MTELNANEDLELAEVENWKPKVMIVATAIGALLGLGVALFGQETLFPQFVNLSWRLVLTLLVFGYVSYRFSRYHGLAAAMLVLFNDHMFFSGVRSFVII